MLPVAAATVFGPGLALLLALGIRQGVILVGAAPAASVGVAITVASGCALLGRPFGPASLLVGAVLLAGIGGLLGWAVRRRLGAPSSPPPATDRPLLPRLAGLTALLAQLAGAVFVVAGAGMALRSWYWGLGSWDTWNQDHDPILHAVLTAYIQRTGRGAPWQIMPADVMVGEPTVYYPDGFHLVAATIGAVFGDPVVGMNAAVAMLLGGAWTTSAAALAAVAVRWLRGGPGWMALGAGLAAVVAAGLYRPGVQLARDNGLLPNAVALALVPGVVAAILVLLPRAWAGAAGVGVGCAGLLAVHPSSGLSVGLTLLAIWAARLFGRDGRAELRAQWPVLAATVGVAAVVAAPVLSGALAVGGRISQFPPDVQNVPITRSLGVVVPLTYGGMYDDRWLLQVWPTVLLVTGLITVVAVRRATPLAVAWLFWVVVVLLAFRNPSGLTAPILGFFYNSATRVQGHIALFAPALATVGAFGLLLALLAGARGVADRIRDRLAGTPFDLTGDPLGRPDPRRRRHPAAGAFGVLALSLLTFGYVAGPSNGYLQTSAEALSQRWAHPQFYRVDADDIAAANWLRSRVRPGQRIMNSANDGSTYLYVHDGLPVVNVSTLGVPGFPYTWQLMRRFQHLGFDPVVRRRILELNIAWVYVDTRAPIIGAEGAPDNWTGGGLLTTVPGLEGLDGTPGLILAHVSGSVQIYKVDLDEVRLLDASA